MVKPISSVICRCKILLFLTIFILSAIQSARAENRYISIDEVSPEMDAYCLTVLEGTKIEKFNLKIVSVVRNYEPGRNLILVIGTDERFQHTGPVRGCSGSPVYIDGRLAGALAMSWSFAKDPLYMVTPIHDMLAVGKGMPSQSDNSSFLPLDFTEPIDLSEINNLVIENLSSEIKPLKSKLPLATSLSENTCSQLTELFEPFGLVPVAAGQAGIDESDSNISLEPGSCLTVPLVSGDISIAATGTATEVVDNKVYGFGHQFLGYGAVDLPMAPGKVHTVITNMLSSFKLASPLEPIGAITADESTAVYGQIGKKAKTIPLKITVNHFNDTQVRVYNCKMAVNRTLMPVLLQSSILGAGTMKGDFPPEHTVEYKVDIAIEGYDDITFQNISSGKTLAEMLGEVVGVTSLLTDNPFKKAEIESLNFEIKITPDDSLARLYSIKLSDNRVYPGQIIDISVILEGHLSKKETVDMSFRIPQDLPAGKYGIEIAGALGFQQFERKLAPHKFTAHNLQTIIKSLNNILKIRRDRLYFSMQVPSGGVTVRQKELPWLPLTKSVLLEDTKRTIPIQSLNKWIQNDKYINKIVTGKARMEITVEKL